MPDTLYVRIQDFLRVNRLWREGRYTAGAIDLCRELGGQWWEAFQRGGLVGVHLLLVEEETSLLLALSSTSVGPERVAGAPGEGSGV